MGPDQPRIEERVANIEGILSQMNERLGHLDGRINHLDGRINSLDGRIDGLNGRIDSLNERINHEISELRAELRNKADKWEIRIWFLIIVLLITVYRFLG